MALYDEIFNYYPDLFPTPGLSKISSAEGVIALLLAAVSTAYTLMSEDAVEKVSSAISKMRLFRSYSQDDIEEMVARVGDFYSRYGAKPVIKAAIEVVPPDLRESVFAIAADLVLAGGASLDGLTTLMRMQDILKIPHSIAQQVIQVMRIKSRG